MKGLVSSARRLRSALAKGMSESERAALVAWRGEVLAAVKEVFARHGCGPEALSAQSREAWRFLEQTDPAKAPLHTAKSEEAAAPSLRLSGVVSAMDDAARAIWSDRKRLVDSVDARTQWADRLRSRAAGIAFSCSSAGGSPANLPERSAWAYGWIALHGDAARILELATWLSALSDSWERQGLSGRLIEVRAVTQRALWKVGGELGAAKAVINSGLTQGHPDPSTFAAFARCLARHPRDGDRERVRALSESPHFTACWDEIRDLAGSKSGGSVEHRGLHHDLSASYGRILPLLASLEGDRREGVPDLRWTRDGTRSLFGRYDRVLDRITISRTLDDAALPDFVVDYVVYHEALHRELGVACVDGRRQVHPPEFKLAERCFARWKEAERLLSGLALRD